MRRRSVSLVAATVAAQARSDINHGTKEGLARICVCGEERERECVWRRKVRIQDGGVRNWSGLSLSLPSAVARSGCRVAVQKAIPVWQGLRRMNNLGLQKGSLTPKWVMGGRESIDWAIQGTTTKARGQLGALFLAQQDLRGVLQDKNKEAQR